MSIAIQDIAQANATTASFALGVIAGVAKLMPLNTMGSAIQYAGTGTGAVTRTVKTKIEETCRSIMDWGVDNTGTTDCTTAVQNAITQCAGRSLYFPQGTYKVTNIDVNKNIYIFGDGKESTHINVVGTGRVHGMKITGDSGLAGANMIRLSRFHLHYSGTGLQAAAGANDNWSGIYIQRKVIMDEVFVENFTNDGIYFAPADAVEGATTTLGTIGQAVFFSEMRNVWSKSNGRDGIRVRMGANANTFWNCQFDKNGAYGFHHMTDGGATYGNTVIGGQCSYNAQYGWYIESGTELSTLGIYAELNGSPDGTSANGYTNTPIDFYVGDNASRSSIGLGVVFNSSSTHVRAPSKGLNDSIRVFRGGTRFFVSTGYQEPYLGATVANSTATTVAGIVADYNALLTALRNANHIA